YSVGRAFSRCLVHQARLSNTKAPKSRARIRPRRIPMPLFRIVLIMAAAACGTTAFAGERPPITSDDDAACRPKGAPGSQAYVDCRHAIVEAREQQKAIIQEQKRRDFDRLLGDGTGGFDESF